MTRYAADRTSDVFHPDCPARLILDHVTSRWGTLIICALSDGGSLRFHELRDTIGGISEKMLSQNLRTLVGDGLLERTVEPTTPPGVSYALTPLGRALAPHLQGLVGWITAHADEILAAQEPDGTT